MGEYKCTRKFGEKGLVMAHDAVEQLNIFLRGELSAVETYTQALEKVDEAPIRTQLEMCRQSHQRRVELLRDEVQRLGGQPSSSSGTWGTFAKIVEGSATIIGDKAALSALEEGEDHGMKLYQENIDEIPPSVRTLVQSALLPEQRKTHETMRHLKHQA